MSLTCIPVGIWLQGLSNSTHTMALVGLALVLLGLPLSVPPLRPIGLPAEYATKSLPAALDTPPPIFRPSAHRGRYILAAISSAE